MGLSVNLLTTALLDLAPESSLRFHQSAASTVGVVAQGLAAAGGGAGIALAASTDAVFVGIVAAGVTIAFIAYLVAPRIAVDCATN